MNAREQYNFEVAGDIPEEYDHLNKANKEARRLAAEIQDTAEAEFLGQTPKPMTRSSLPLVPLKCDARYFVEDEYKWIRERNAVIDAFQDGDRAPMYLMLLDAWRKQLAREVDYRAYNIKALAKRHAKGSPPEEIARVQSLIDEGAAKIDHIRSRLQWTEMQCAS